VLNAFSGPPSAAISALRGLRAEARLAGKIAIMRRTAVHVDAQARREPVAMIGNPARSPALIAPDASQPARLERAIGFDMGGTIRQDDADHSASRRSRGLCHRRRLHGAADATPLWSISSRSAPRRLACLVDGGGGLHVVL